MHDVEVLEQPEVALAALDPVRARLLAALVEPASAAAVAARLGLPRQRVGHHLRALEAVGLVRQAGERRHGGLVERVLQASAAAYVVSPAAVSPQAADPALVADRLSARHLVAVAGRVVRELGALLRQAGDTGTRVPTMALTADVGFATAAARAAFADELTEAVLAVVARHHTDARDGGRMHRLVVAAHPVPPEEAA